MPPLLERLGVELPVVQAGMGGGLSRHELAAAVSEAGGLGTIAVSGAAAIRRELVAAPLVAGEGLQFGEQAGDFAGDRDGGVALVLGLGFFQRRVGELFGLVLGLLAQRPRHRPRVGGFGRVAGDAVGDQLPLRGERAERFDATVQLIVAEVAAAAPGEGEGREEQGQQRRPNSLAARRGQTALGIPPTQGERTSTGQLVDEFGGRPDGVDPGDGLARIESAGLDEVGRPVVGRPRRATANWSKSTSAKRGKRPTRSSPS